MRPPFHEPPTPPNTHTHRMIGYLKQHFRPDCADPDHSLAIMGGAGGARLTHSHGRQYSYVLQSLTLWREVSHEVSTLLCGHGRWGGWGWGGAVVVWALGRQALVSCDVCGDPRALGRWSLSLPQWRPGAPPGEARVPLLTPPARLPCVPCADVQALVPGRDGPAEGGQLLSPPKHRQERARRAALLPLRCKSSARSSPATALLPKPRR
jgi:hypothetical protein